jgi:hypothetical protein
LLLMQLAINDDGRAKQKGNGRKPVGRIDFGHGCWAMAAATNAIPNRCEAIYDETHNELLSLPPGLQITAAVTGRQGHRY